MLGTTNAGNEGLAGVQIGTSIVNPKIGDLQINSSTPVNKFAFSFNEPVSPSLGDIWFILINKKGVTQTDLLLGNNSILAPVWHAKQWNGTQWVDVQTNIYAQSGWQTTKWYLLYNGADDQDSVKWRTAPNGYGDAYKQGTTTFASGYIRLYTSTAYGVRVGLATYGSASVNDGLVDLTDAQYVKFRVNPQNGGTTATTYNMGFYVSTSNTSTGLYNASNVKVSYTASGSSISNGSQIITLDVRNLQGFYHIGCDIWKSGNLTFYMDIYDIWLE